MIMLKIMDKVKIKDLEVVGTIISIHQQIGKDEYQVRYFYDGTPQTIYYHDFELEKIK